jgi:hypothetical protein
MTDPAAAPAPAQPEKANLFEDFVDIFGSPATVFARRATSSPMMPFLIVCVLLIGMFVVNKNLMAPIMDAEMQKGFEAAMKANPNLTPEMMERMKGTTQTFAVVGAAVFVPISVLVLGLVTWAVGRAFGGTLSYGSAVLIASFAWIPRVVEAVLNSVQGLVLDVSKMTSHYQLTLSAARFLDPSTASPMVLGLLGRVDLITIWVTVLVSIGLVAAGKMPKEKVIVAGIVMWVVGAIPALYGAWRAM